MGNIVNKNFNISKWKEGLLVAMVTGLFTMAVSGQVNSNSHWKELLWAAFVNISVQSLLYIKTHPLSEDESQTKVDETEIIKKDAA